jgi:hypothetical protein
MVWPQDAWIFKSPMIKPHANKELNIDFPLGYPGCDNRVAWEFRNIGLHVINPGTNCGPDHNYITDNVSLL